MKRNNWLFGCRRISPFEVNGHQMFANAVGGGGKGTGSNETHTYTHASERERDEERGRWVEEEESREKGARWRGHVRCSRARKKRKRIERE